MSLSTPSLTTPSETCAQAVPQPRMQTATVRPSIRFMRFLLGDAPTYRFSRPKYTPWDLSPASLGLHGSRDARTFVWHYSTPHSCFQSVRKLPTIHVIMKHAGGGTATDAKA